MREIKFRTWLDKPQVVLGRRPKNQMVYFPLINMPAFIDNTLLQYTGLKDKNGVEIYEGDVVKTNFNDFITGIVEFRFAEFVIARGSWVDSLTNLTRNHWTFEVIGNSYENPELVK